MPEQVKGPKETAAAVGGMALGLHSPGFPQSYIGRPSRGYDPLDGLVYDDGLEGRDWRFNRRTGFGNRACQAMRTT